MTETYGEGYFERGEGSNYHSYGDDPRWVQILAEMNKLHHNNSTLFEVGSAKGWFIHHARLMGYVATGIDISEYAVENCAPKAKGYLFRCDAIDGFGVMKQSQRIVCSWEFFEHINEDKVDSILDEMIRVLKPNGTLWLRIALSDGASAETDVDATHVTMKPREWWEDKLNQRISSIRRMVPVEKRLDTLFEGTDWSGRFFVCKKV